MDEWRAPGTTHIHSGSEPALNTDTTIYRVLKFLQFARVPAYSTRVHQFYVWLVSFSFFCCYFICVLHLTLVRICWCINMPACMRGACDLLATPFTCIYVSRICVQALCFYARVFVIIFMCGWILVSISYYSNQLRLNGCVCIKSV